MEIITRDKKSHVFLLHGVGTISFSSVSITESTPQDFVDEINNTHKIVCGEECQALDANLKIDCPKHDMINAECSDPVCYFYRKSLKDSEFTCIDFLENPKQNITGLLKTYLEEHGIGKIIEINLHGFSARDTCLACFCHLGLYCEKANQVFNSEGREEDANFWQKLKSVLFPDIPNPQIPVRFYISSKIKYDSTEYFGNDKEREEKNRKTIEGADAHLDSLQKIRAKLEKKVKEDSVNFMNMFVIRENFEKDCEISIENTIKLAKKKDTKKDYKLSAKDKFELQLVHDENLCEKVKGCIPEKIGEMSFKEA